MACIDTTNLYWVSSFTALLSLTELYGPYIVYLYLFMHVQQTAYSDLHNSWSVFCNRSSNKSFEFESPNFTFPSDRFIKTNKTTIIIIRRKCKNVAKQCAALLTHLVITYSSNQQFMIPWKCEKNVYQSCVCFSTNVRSNCCVIVYICIYKSKSQELYAC